jgi:3',5'-cyclic AMP phosphodiesterase CpdA
MTHALSLAHISDLHLTPIVGFGPQHWNVKRGLGYLNWMRSRRRIHSRTIADLMAVDIRAHEADHIAVTGDISNLGLPDEFGEARRWLETVGPPDRVTAIPGNHDIYTRRMNGPSCLETWNGYLISDEWGRGVMGQTELAFPFVRRLGRVALIGLNSAIPTRPLVAAGRLGDTQLAALDGLLARLEDEGLVRVVLIHHPPLPGQTAPRRALQDADALAAVLSQRGAELVLHGHNHRDSLVWHPARGGAIPVVGVASGSASRPHGPEPLGRYNIYRFGGSADSRSIEMIVRGLGGEGGEVVEISRQRLVQGE